MILFALLVIYVSAEFNQKYSDCVKEVGDRPVKEIDFICDRFKVISSYEENQSEPTTLPSRVLCDLGADFRANIAIGSPCNQYKNSGFPTPKAPNDDIKQTDLSESTTLSPKVICDLGPSSNGNEAIESLCNQHKVDETTSVSTTFPHRYSKCEVLTKETLKQERKEDSSKLSLVFYDECMKSKTAPYFTLGTYCASRTKWQGKSMSHVQDIRAGQLYEGCVAQLKPFFEVGACAAEIEKTNELEEQRDIIVADCLRAQAFKDTQKVRPNVFAKIICQMKSVEQTKNEGKELSKITGLCEIETDAVKKFEAEQDKL